MSKKHRTRNQKYGEVNDDGTTHAPAIFNDDSFIFLISGIKKVKPITTPASTRTVIQSALRNNNSYVEVIMFTFHGHSVMLKIPQIIPNLNAAYKILYSVWIHWTR
jgi:hypothetical protein